MATPHYPQEAFLPTRKRQRVCTPMRAIQPFDYRCQVVLTDVVLTDVMADICQDPPRYLHGCEQEGDAVPPEVAGWLLAASKRSPAWSAAARSAAYATTISAGIKTPHGARGRHVGHPCSRQRDVALVSLLS